MTENFTFRGPDVSAITGENKDIVHFILDHFLSPTPDTKVFIDVSPRSTNNSSLEWAIETRGPCGIRTYKITQSIPFSKIRIEPE